MSHTAAYGYSVYQKYIHKEFEDPSAHTSIQR